jgi:mono/diheme cytochrome c family protein
MVFSMSRSFSNFLIPLLLASAAARGEHIDPTTTVASWTFDSADIPGKWEGKKPAEISGPRSPVYPEFNNTNKAIQFPGNGRQTALVVPDNGPDGPNSLRFHQGDSITLEAWVRPGNAQGNEVYLIGKGRSHKPGFDKTNQNYGLRIKRGANGLQVGFIFSTHDGNNKDRKFHVWWSKDEALQQASSWHHVAVTYTYGQAGSLRGYLDGKPVPGDWSYGGATDRAPTTDADELVIGSGMERGAGSSLSGGLDNVAIHRTALSGDVIRRRFAYTPPQPAIAAKDVPEGKVLIQVCEEDVPSDRTWPESNPKPALSYTEDAFGLFEIPQKYITTGVRADRAPALVRAAALVDIPAGKHRLLLRARGGSRLYINGQQILSTPFARGDTGGHGHTSDQDNYLDLGPDFRFAPPGNRESWVEFTSKGGKQLILLETIIGTATQRPELGETVVAISPEGSEHWRLLSPGKSVFPYTDAGWKAYESERRPRIAEMNRQARAKQRETQKEYWDKRRKLATDWLASTKEQPVPDLAAGHPANNPIDHFISARIAKVAADTKAAPEGGVDYFKDVRPILETKCYDCHQGGKVKGDLRLDTRENALIGGSDEGPSIVVGKPSESPLIHRIITDDEDLVMPPKGARLSKEEVAILEKWIEQGAVWPEFHVENFQPTELASDLEFLRRVFLDTTGVVPNEKEIEDFLADTSADKRTKVIDKLLADPRWADHWTSYWQDVLAENPNIINPTLNNTGPFRWWIHESLEDNKPMDLFVTELVRLEGSDRYGGPRGFGTATQNDSPMAEKGAVVAAAFLGVEMKCARCHDAPAHVSLQEDLFSLAALFEQKPVKVPATSSVPMDKLHEGGRKPLIKVTLKPGTEVQPKWPFKFADPALGDELALDPKNTRDRFASLITAPQNERFSQVIVNRLWQRLMGRGIVENVADWEKGEPTHPELLNWLSREFVRSGYDFKAVARLILNSHAYQRATDETLPGPSPLYVAPAPRRLAAEQIVDSLFTATGKPFDLEEVSLDLDSNRSVSNSITLGVPTRAWMLASTSNERDRPSLSLPKIQAVSTVLEAFGWRGARQDPVSIRDNSPNTLQPAIISNGTMGHWLTVLSEDHGVTQLALEKQPVDQFIDRLYLRLLTRKPTSAEREAAIELLKPGYESRVVEAPPAPPAGKRVRPYYFTWSNHLDGIANELAVQAEETVRKGAPPTGRLNADWRERTEDLIWSLLNTPEWIFTP